MRVALLILDKYRDERDARGDLTLLAIAIDALTDTECDCADGACLPRACERALIEVVKGREALRAEIRALRESSDYYERLADELSQQIGWMK